MKLENECFIMHTAYGPAGAVSLAKASSSLRALGPSSSFFCCERDFLFVREKKNAWDFVCT